MSESGETPDVVLCRQVGWPAIRRLIGRYDGLELRTVGDGEPIPGSYWGAPEAGLLGHAVIGRGDTPIHSLLHEASHLICMDEPRRAALDTEAGGDDAEENGVCYLQILLADHLPETSRHDLMVDMDRWGYSFRLGSTRAWFEQDAEDARIWLIEHGLIDPEGEITFRLRRDAPARPG